MRTYLVVLDASDEARIALRFAARRAAKTGGTVEILAVIEPSEFIAWSGVQAAMEEEAGLKVEAMVAGAAGAIIEEAGIRPAITVKAGEPVVVVRALLAERTGVAALVLGAAAEGAPGPLIAHYIGVAGSMPCPLMIVPGGLSDEALDELS